MHIVCITLGAFVKIKSFKKLNFFYYLVKNKVVQQMKFTFDEGRVLLCTSNGAGVH